jgi:predicted esterase
MKRTVLIAIFLLLAFQANAQDQPASGMLPPLDQQISITQWHVVGPFLSGSREPLIDFLGSSLDRVTGKVDLTATYMSVQDFGGEVAWQLTTAGTDGVLKVSFDNPAWDKIQDEWGGAGVYFSGAAYATFQCDKACRALVNANGTGGFLINGRVYTGDPYGNSLLLTPVILDQGENRVVAYLGGAGGSDSMTLTIAPPKQDIMIMENDVLLPDMIRGETLSSPAGVPILNTTDTWLRDLTMTIGGNGPLRSTEITVPEIPPLCVVKVPIELATDGHFPATWETKMIDVPITVHHGDEVVGIKAIARVRNHEDSGRMTFISGMDGSAQKFGVLYPSNYDPTRTYALILALHGAGVEGDGMVDSYEARDWAFIVCPTNRRPFGFDWQDWGRLDALEVLDQAFNRYHIDPNKVYLTGHSMGGHGAWLVGCTHADKFAAVVPSAGWASFQLYTPWFLRTDSMLFDPELAKIFDALSSPDRTERLLPNLRNVPVFAVQGGDDDDVPPTHPRLLIGMLKNMGYDATYWEEPGMGHWWDKNPNLVGVDCVDALRIRSFMKDKVRDQYPKHVTLTTYDLGNTNQKYWVTVDEEANPIGQVFVDAELNHAGEFTCSTLNVSELTFDFGRGFPYPRPERVTIDDQTIKLEFDLSGKVSLVCIDGRWNTGTIQHEGLRKTSDFRGPMKRAYFKPFVLVIGTKGTETENSYYLELARTTSQRWWYRANGYTRIVRDVDVDDSIISQYNLVLLGGPLSNSVSAQIADSLPIAIEDGGVMVGDKFLKGEDLAVKFLYPNPLAPENLILAEWGTSPEGMRLAGSLNCMYSGSGLPDFLVYDDAVRQMGYAGVRAAGFFNNDWQVDKEFCYIR